LAAPRGRKNADAYSRDSARGRTPPWHSTPATMLAPSPAKRCALIKTFLDGSAYDTYGIGDAHYGIPATGCSASFRRDFGAVS
jgi:hypothetical protein